MAVYKLKVMGTVIPTEVNTLSDGVDTIETINSRLDKIYGSENIISFGTTPTNVQQAIYSTTITDTGLNQIINVLPQTINFIFVKIIEQLSSGTPTVEITLNSASPQIRLSGVGDFCILRTVLDSIDIQIRSSAATNIAKIEILVGGQ